MRTLVLCLAVLLSVASAQQGHAKFQLYFGCGYPNNGTNLLNGTTIQVCGFTPNSIVTTPVTTGSCPSFIVTVESGNLPQGGADCTVTVSEGGLSVSRLFQKALANVTYNWTDLTANLAINIRDWNPWCAVSPYGGYNGGKIAILADQGNGPSVFRQYSRKPLSCTPGGNTVVPWSGFPRLANGDIFGSSCNLTGGYYNTTVTVAILRTNAPINVYAEEYSDFRVFTQGLCDPQVYVVGHAPLTSYPSVSAPYSTFVPFDTNCSDGSCSSGLLISRLQIPNRCYEPPQSVFDPLNPIGQAVYLTDNLTYTQFPRTTILLTWTPENNNQFTYRWSSGQDNALIVEYTLAVNDIVVSSQWTDVPNNGKTPTLVVNGTFVKEPVAGCYSGYCEAQPITSTLHVDTQGFCDQIDSISVYQQQWNAPFGQVAPAFVNFRPNCSQLYNTNELLFCVWNNRNTRVSINYRTRGSTNIATVPSPSNDINCQVTLQKCDARGGLTPLCPNLGCLDDELGNGPTQLNVATALPQDDGSNFLVDYFVTSPAALRNTSANGGCFWVPALPGLQLTISEGCCQYPLTPNGALSPQYNRGGFTGAGCVQYTSNTTDCTSPTSCTTVEEFGRTLALFDLAYMPRDDGVSTTSVSLENPEDCSPFRFKTSQGGAPRCYCVLPINVKARIIETNLETTAQACKCTDTVSCVQRYESRDEDCTICNWASDLTFDLRGLPWNTEVNLWVGSAPSFSPAAFKRLRQYTRGVGNVWNKLTVLRNGIQNNESCSQEVGCADQWYCVESIDGAASLTLCVRCDTKICRTQAFTRDLCIDLENPCPNGTTYQLFDVVISRRTDTGSIATWPATSSAPFAWSGLSSLVRTVPRQGGVNGCSSPAPFKRELEPIPQEVMEAEELSQDQMMAMTEEDLLDYEARNQMHGVSKEEASRERLSFFNPANTGHYTVLRLDNYDVTLFEGNVRKTINVNCSAISTSSCSPTNAPSLGYLNCLCWNTTCVGNAYNSTTGLNGGTIPSDNIWVTLGGNGQNIFDPLPQSTATNLTVLRRHQIRGPRGFWTQNITTCEWSMLTFINATWQKVGNQNQCVPVIQSNSLSLTVEEGIIYSPTIVWPDPRGHPTITVPVNCVFNLTAYPSCSQNTLDPLCYCYVRPSMIYSLWRIVTVRSLDSATLPALVLKYTSPYQYFFSNQNVFREIPANSTNYGSGLQRPNPQQWRLGDNFICVVADPYFGFSFNWGAFAFPLTTNPIYQPNYNLSNSQFACPTDVLPRSNISQTWAEDLNTCRQCENFRNGTAIGWAAFATLTDVMDVFTRNWCRLAFIPPGSDFLNDYPLGNYIVFEFN